MVLERGQGLALREAGSESHDPRQVRHLDLAINYKLFKLERPKYVLPSTSTSIIIIIIFVIFVL